MSKKLPEGWKIVKLEDIADIKSGGTPSRSRNEYWNNGDIPWIKISDIKEKYINNSEEFITTEGLGNSSTKLFKKGTILFTIFATLGEVGILNIEATTNQAIAGIEVNKDIVNKEYLYYFLKSLKEKIERNGRGVAQKNINLSILRSYDILLPPLEEQERIVSILEKAENAIEKRVESINLLDEYLKSVFVDMFGDVINNQKAFLRSELGNYIDFLTSGSRGWAKYYSDNGEIFITIKNVKNSKLYFQDITYVTAPNTKEAERTRVKKDDLLISITADLGRTAVVDKEIADLGAYINQHLCLVRLSKSLNPIFISYLLESDACKTIIDSYNQVGVKSGLNFEAIKSIPIFVPSIEIQEEFTHIVDRVESIKNKKLESKTELENNFNSLMQKAFNGEL